MAFCGKYNKRLCTMSSKCSQFLCCHNIYKEFPMCIHICKQTSLKIKEVVFNKHVRMCTHAHMHAPTHKKYINETVSESDTASGLGCNNLHVHHRQNLQFHKIFPH